MTNRSRYAAWPPDGMNAPLDTIKGCWEKAAKKDGRELFERVELIRAEEAAVSGYSLQLAQILDNANGYATHDKGENTGFFPYRDPDRKIKRILRFGNYSCS